MRDALARVQAAAARHPKLLLTLLLVGLLVVSADPVAADNAVHTEPDLLFDSEFTTGDEVTTNDGSSNRGPTNP
jgi:hypothetical protein